MIVEGIGGEKHKMCRTNKKRMKKKYVWKFNSHGIQIRFQRIRTVNGGQQQHQHFHTAKSSNYTHVFHISFRFFLAIIFRSAKDAASLRKCKDITNSTQNNHQNKYIILFITYNLMAESHIGCYFASRLDDNNSIVFFFLLSEPEKKKKISFDRHQQSIEHLPKLQSNTWFLLLIFRILFIRRKLMHRTATEKKTHSDSLERWFVHLLYVFWLFARQVWIHSSRTMDFKSTKSVIKCCPFFHAHRRRLYLAAWLRNSNYERKM